MTNSVRIFLSKSESNGIRFRKMKIYYISSLEFLLIGVKVLFHNSSSIKTHNINVFS